MNLDLTTLSLDELKTLKRDVERQIAGWQERKRREALAAVEEAVRSHGFNLADLGLTGAGRSRGSRTRAAARYANPADPTQTWGGRGRRPGWVNEALAEGRDLKDLEI